MIGATSLAYVTVAAEVALDGSSDRKAPNAANAQNRQKPNAHFITNLLEQVKNYMPYFIWHMENDHASEYSHICLRLRGARHGHRYFKNHSAAALAAAPLSTRVRVTPETRATSVGPLSNFDAATASLSLFTLASFSAMTNSTAVFCGICSTYQNG